MAYRPTKISELTDVILTRHAWVQGPDGQVHPFIFSFHRPRRIGEDEVEGQLRYQCVYFDKTMTLVGSDDLQVMVFLLSIGQSQLSLFAQEGYEVYWVEKGDRNAFDFWSFQQTPHEYALKSAFNSIYEKAFDEANEGKFLTPSHRIAVDSERPCVQVYEVRPDGADVVGAMVTPDKIAAMTTDELCHEIGRTVLFSSREGRRLLGLGPIEDKIRADVEARQKDA